MRISDWSSDVCSSDLLPMAVDLVADVVLRGRCRTADVDVERQVVLEEIAMRDDDPEDLLGDAFLTALFGDHPVGRPIIDSVERSEDRSEAKVCVSTWRSRRWPSHKKKKNNKQD